LKVARLLMILGGFGVLVFSITTGWSASFLSEKDFNLQEESNHQSPPVSYFDEEGTLVPSYNEWLCFSIEGLTLTCSEHEMDELIKIPVLVSYAGKNAFEIEPSPTDGVDCGQTLEIWKNLLEGEQGFCVLAAYLQDLPSGGLKKRSLWILEALKTEQGYWLNPSLSGRLATKGI
tara:strand:+ start:277 stop:801 length:525 start_codon:yes stop_codon:yes gene_type:complete